MAHYAYINKENNKVEMVIVGKDETETINGLTPEAYYEQGTPYMVRRTSYNGNIRKRMAGIGYTYDSTFDVFITPQPYPSWKLNYTTFEWEAPVSIPEKVEGFRWFWSEINKEWIQVQIPNV